MRFQRRDRRLGSDCWLCLSPLYGRTWQKAFYTLNISRSLSIRRVWIKTIVIATASHSFERLKLIFGLLFEGPKITIIHPKRPPTCYTYDWWRMTSLNETFPSAHCRCTNANQLIAFHRSEAFSACPKELHNNCLSFTYHFTSRRQIILSQLSPWRHLDAQSLKFAAAKSDSLKLTH